MKETLAHPLQVLVSPYLLPGTICRPTHPRPALPACDEKGYYEDGVCQYSFLVPSPLGQEGGASGGGDSILELRDSTGAEAVVLGRSDHFVVTVSSAHIVSFQ